MKMMYYVLYFVWIIVSNMYEIVKIRGFVRKSKIRSAQTKFKKSQIKMDYKQ